MLPVFYINLARRTDRRVFMERQFAALGIRAERIEATTPDDLTAEQRAVLPASAWGQGPSDMACVLSHRAAWTHMVRRRLPAAVILEDDVVLGRGFAACLAEDILDRSGYGLIHLEALPRPILLGSRSRPLAGDIVLRTMITTLNGAGAYLISAAIAAAAAADAAAPLMEVDRYLFGRGGRWLTEIEVGQAVPAPCLQLEFIDRAKTGAAASDLSAGRRERTSNPSPAARRERNRANLRYSLAVLARRLRDPATFFSRRVEIGFSGPASTA
ncbi:MAG: glycosyltransferase family 25 protein [Devosia sp.]|nr:glycosyltransferase family 25 protein [Devosia sp.]